MSDYVQNHRKRGKTPGFSRLLETGRQSGEPDTLREKITFKLFRHVEKVVHFKKVLRFH